MGGGGMMEEQAEYTNKISEILNKITFTASEMHKFMGKTGSKTAETECYKKVAIALGVARDAVYGSYTSPAMQWGIETEALAIKWVNRILGASFIKQEEGKKHSKHPISATPDGFDGKAVLEVKCPNTDTHLKYLANIQDNKTMMDVCPEYYYQIQTQMLVYGVEMGYFCSFDPRLDKLYGIKIVPILKHTSIHRDIIDKAEYYHEFCKEIIEKIHRK